MSTVFHPEYLLDHIIPKLRCPTCHSSLITRSTDLYCQNNICRKAYPIVKGVPILIDESRSIFSVEDFQQQRSTTFRQQSEFKAMVGKVIPSIGLNISAQKNYHEFSELVKRQTQVATVLVIGGGAIGEGFETLMNDPCIRLVEIDVSFGQRVSLICDAHDLPFEDGTFDGVVAQAVLEHVVDPMRCVSEIYRVIKPEGLVYAETPFMQQVHMGRFDFTRFTHLGHRRLFRQFSEVGSGVACGPGMALAWAYEYFLLSLTSTPLLRATMRLFARFTSWHLKYFDYFLARKPGAFDAASGFYFIGRKSGEVLSDRELIRSYRGAL